MAAHRDDPRAPVWRECMEGLVCGLIAERSGARVISAEILLPDDPAVPHAGTDLDMRRLAIGGRERTHGDYAALLGTAGLTVSCVLSTASPLSVIDARHAVAGRESPLRATRL